MDLRELSATCARSLTVRGKQPPSNSFSRAWKAGNLMRLRSGLICEPSRGQRFLDAWTSSLAVIPASHSHPPVSDSEQTTSDTSGQLSQLAFGFCDQESVSLKTSRDTSPLGYGKSSMSWEAWVTERRGEYSARLKLARLTSESEYSSWPTASTRDWKDTPGMAKESTDKDGSHRNRTDQLARAVYAYGQADPANRSTGGSRQESWRTPSSSDGEGGVMEMREDCAGRYKLRDHVIAVQNPQWATPITGKLNPRWVETLMGLPIGWVMASCASPMTIEPTSFGCWATESSPQPQQELL